MVYQERNTWSQLIATLVALIVYVILIVQAAAGVGLALVQRRPCQQGICCTEQFLCNGPVILFLVHNASFFIEK